MLNKVGIPLVELGYASRLPSNEGNRYGGNGANGGGSEVELNTGLVGGRGRGGLEEDPTHSHWKRLAGRAHTFFLLFWTLTLFLFSFIGFPSFDY